jgi:hypothetical protein
MGSKFSVVLMILAAPLIGALALTFALVATAKRGRQELWTVAASIVGVALLGQWFLPGGIPLFEHHCGPRCGAGFALMPAVAAFSAAGAAGILSIRHRRAPRLILRVLAFIAILLTLLAGVQLLWIAQKLSV